MPRTRTSVNRRSFALTSGAAAGALALTLAPGGHHVLAARQATPGASPVATPAADWDAVATQVDAVAPLATYLACEILGEDIAPIAGLNEGRAQGVGSSFKLYILAALGAQVADGTLDWNQAVEIEEALLSVPGGDLRYVAPGTAFTMRYIAERMIQRSDNTATDHALALAGRENVEEMFVTAGHAEPTLNVPLLTTREFAMLKFVHPDVDGYLAADEATRRETLATDIAALSYEDLLEVSEEQTAPIRIDTVEWFASPTDLARVMVTLKSMAESTFDLQPLFEIMALETQLPFDAEIWPYVGFKGGSELGVLHATWMLRRHDDRWFVLSMGFNDAEAGIDMAAAIGAFEAGFAALEQQA